MWLILLLTAIILLCYWLKRKHSYWKRKGVPQTNPTFIFGDTWGAVSGKQSMHDLVEYTYNSAKNTRYVGGYTCLSPVFIIKDLELIKQVTVKDFEHFQDHTNFIPDTSDPLWAKNLFALKGQRWKDMRCTLSPSFTSSKMRMMFPLISEASQDFIKYFSKKDVEELRQMEMKDIFSRYTTDIIASVAFGVKCDSLTDRENEFYMMGKEVNDMKGVLKMLKAVIMILSQTLTKIFGLSLFSKRVSNFFRNLVKETIETREKQNITRPDMIHLLMEARKNGLRYDEGNTPTLELGFATVEESEIGKTDKVIKHALTNDDITAQALIFFFAGFDTVSWLLCLMCYELAVNTEVQERLVEEVDAAFEECGGSLTYEALMKMKYLDMVVTETLRKWPIAAAVDRQVTKAYVIQPKTPDEHPVTLDVGQTISIPVYAIHRDPNYYPKPDIFDPERFNDVNKAGIKPYSYLPFGSGPRNCIGSRFALLETKTVMVHILSAFELVTNEKTDTPLRPSKKLGNMVPITEFWLGFKPRKTRRL